ncbi:hypothetical protein SDC9_154581 [bioreactor metagenome]|uniref:Uncharacterized protein n=1 Tax=bioreactor metagenome TaxID=1076179 RepID=A0A645EZ29_9ZZZZ
MHPGRPPPTRYDADVELHLTPARRGTGERERTAAGTTVDFQIDVLPRLEMDRLVELDEHPLDRRRQVLKPTHGTGKIPHRNRFGIGLLLDLRFDHEITLQTGATGQRLAFVALKVHQCKAGGLTVVHFAVHHLHFAGGAQTMAAGMRQPDAGPQSSVEDGLVVLDFEGLAEGFDGQFVAHDLCPEGVEFCLPPLSRARAQTGILNCTTLRFRSVRGCGSGSRPCASNRSPPETGKNQATRACPT